MKTKHSTEQDVLFVSSVRKSEQKVHIELLRLKGNFYHNLKVLKVSGELKVYRRPSTKEEINVKNYGPCVNCLAFVKKSELWRHKKKCPFNKYHDVNHEYNRKLKFESELMLYGSSSTKNTALHRDVISTMRNDDVTYVAKND